MAATAAPKQRAPRRSWPPAEKRRIVELTLREGASLLAIAREHDVHPNSLGQWKALYRAGKLDAPVKPTARVSGPAANATFVPVSADAAIGNGLRCSFCGCWCRSWIRHAPLHRRSARSGYIIKERRM